MSSPDSIERLMSEALAVRLNLQMSLSAVSTVEEWMDIHFSRWLEQIPLVTEMPEGHQVYMGVTLGSDLTRVMWSAWGDPRGFVPKVANYLRLRDISKTDESLLEQVGTTLDPQSVGTWIGARPGEIASGWQFCDTHPWSVVETMFGVHTARVQLSEWAKDTSTTKVQRFAQAIGEPAYTELEFGLTTDSFGQQLDAAQQAVQRFVGRPLPEKTLLLLQELFGGEGWAEVALGVRIVGGQITRTSVVIPPLPHDAFERLCASVEAPCQPKLSRMLAGLSAGGMQAAVLAVTPESIEVDTFVEPSGQLGKLRSGSEAN